MKTTSVNNPAETVSQGRAIGLASLTRAWPIFAALLLGVFLIYGVSLANPETIHNAAHDSRHSFSFPCH